MSIGERIISLRKQRGISQYQLAQSLGISRQAVSKWENDQSSPDTLNLIKLAELLDTNVEYLANGTDPQAHSSPPPAVQIVERQVEVEKIVEVEKLVEVERIIDRVVEKPVIRKVTRVKYRRNTAEYLIVGAGCFILGLLIGLVF